MISDYFSNGDELQANVSSTSENVDRPISVSYSTGGALLPGVFKANGPMFSPYRSCAWPLLHAPVSGRPYSASIPTNPKGGNASPPVIAQSVTWPRLKYRPPRLGRHRPTQFSSEHLGTTQEASQLWERLNNPHRIGPKRAAEGFRMAAINLSEKGEKFAYALAGKKDFAKSHRILKSANRGDAHHGVYVIEHTVDYIVKVQECDQSPAMFSE